MVVAITIHYHKITVSCPELKTTKPSLIRISVTIKEFSKHIIIADKSYWSSKSSISLAVTVKNKTKVSLPAKNRSF